MIMVNNFFAHFVKEISVTKHESNKELIPSFSPYEIYQYFDAMLKHLPADALKTIEKTPLYSKKAVSYNDVNIERKIHNGDRITTTEMNATQMTTSKKIYAKDINIGDRITKFKEQLKNEHVYRIPLRYFTDLGKINFPTKINYRIKLHFETKMKKLFDIRKVLASILTPDPKVIFTKAPFIQYEQILLDKNLGNI